MNSLTSVSLEPPLVSFCPSRSSLTWSRMRRDAALRRERAGATARAVRDTRDALPARTDSPASTGSPGRGGVPLLTDALATLECEIVAEHPAGDHWIVVGRVDDLRISPINDPLVFFAGAFRPWTVSGALRAPALEGDTPEAAGLREQAMSQENVEVVRRTLEAFNREGVEAALAYMDPAIEWIGPPEWLEDAVYTGHDGIRKLASGWTDNFDEYRLEWESGLDAGDHVVALVFARARIKRSGNPIEQRIGYDWEVRGGKGVRVRVHFSWEGALEAAGLRR